MQEFARNRNVLPDDIITEDQSCDTIANAQECNKLFASLPLQHVRSALLVSSGWHMLRAYIIMRKHISQSVSLACCPTPLGVCLANYKTGPNGDFLVNNELRLIGKLLKQGYVLPVD